MMESIPLIPKVESIPPIPKKKKKKKKGKKMEEKKFDSATKILDELKKENVNPILMYYGFIESIHNMLTNYYAEINGAPAQDFFIQGLIAITGDPEAFEVALEYFMNKYFDLSKY